METAYTAFATQVIELCNGGMDMNLTVIFYRFHFRRIRLIGYLTGISGLIFILVGFFSRYINHQFLSDPYGT